jgi:hypothetical protein
MSTNLQFIKSQDIVSGSLTFEMTDCFNSDYDVYKVIFSGMQLTITNEHYPLFRFLDTSDNEILSSNYGWAALILLATSGFQTDNETADDGFASLFIFGSTSTGEGNCEMTVYKPFDSSSYTFINSMDSSSVTLDGRKNVGVLKLAQSVTGLKLINSSGYIMGTGTVSVYGVK